MARLLNLKPHADSIGAITGILCFLHCMVTPLLFVMQADLTAGEATHPWWWGTMDISFLAISLLAIYWSVKKTDKPWVKFAFWCLWALLAIIVGNEKLELVALAGQAIYLPTLGLVALHFFNHHSCACCKSSDSGV